MEIYQPAFANMTIKVYILRMPLAKIKKQVNLCPYFVLHAKSPKGGFSPFENLFSDFYFSIS